MDTAFKFRSRDTLLEIQGPEEFVRAQIGAIFGAAARPEAAPPAPETAVAAPPAAESEMAAWFRRTVPPKMIPSMQDSVLLFAYFLNRQKRQFIFVPDDMKAGFTAIDREIPKSLLQILGSLKRDAGLLYSGDKRGEYCLTPAGLRHVEALLGVKRPEPEPPKEIPAKEPVSAPPPPAANLPAKSTDQVSELDRLFSRFPRPEVASSGNGASR